MSKKIKILILLITVIIITAVSYGVYFFFIRNHNRILTIEQCTVQGGEVKEPGSLFRPACTGTKFLGKVTGYLCDCVCCRK